jgi:hypothetical protein
VSGDLLMMIDVVGLVVLGVGGSPWLKVLYIGLVCISLWYS